MNVTINIFMILGIIVPAVLVGYFIGRNERKLLREEAEDEGAAGREMGSSGGAGWEQVGGTTVWESDGGKTGRWTDGSGESGRGTVSGTSARESENSSGKTGRWTGGGRGTGREIRGSAKSRSTKRDTDSSVYRAEDREMREREPFPDRHHRNGEKRISQGITIASPAAGRTEVFYERGRHGVMIEPEEGKIFAPASGKIIKLYPMGNAFVLRMDEQIELYISVGNHPDELCSMYFQPRIVQNEIIHKGKLLLLFDRERLRAAGEDVTVTVSLEDGVNEREIAATMEERVKVGDELIKVY